MGVYRRLGTDAVHVHLAYVENGQPGIYVICSVQDELRTDICPTPRRVCPLYSGLLSSGSTGDDPPSNPHKGYSNMLP